MSDRRKVLGAYGEDAARRYLVQQGYRILASNYKTKLGEIDIIAQDKDTICFIEVKARSSSAKGVPAESVTGLKQQRIAKAALLFLKQKRMLDARARFDVVSVDCSGSAPVIDLLKNAFELGIGYTY